MFTFIFFAVTATSFSCNPNKDSSNPVTSLSVSGPDKKFVVGESLYKSDISVYAIYKNETSKKVTNFTCPEFDNATSYKFETAKTYTFNITYSNITKPLKITVKDSEEDKDDYTLFIYMCASTLEDETVKAQEEYGYTETYGAASLDLAEILYTTDATPDNVNIIIETGGTTKWGNYLGDQAPNPNYIQRFYVHDHELKLIKNISYGSGASCKNMGDESILSDFLTWGVNAYPAKNYALILWDHGGAMDGVCFDSKYASETGKQNDMLLNSEVHASLKKAYAITGQKFEWIGYDACLMNVQDIAGTNADYCKYMVASQENEPGDGWYYTEWITSLYNNPTSTYTKTLLNQICSSYSEYYNAWNEYVTQEGYPDYTVEATLAALDLSKSSTYKNYWNTFVTALSEKIKSKDNFNTFANKFFNDCLKFGKIVQDETEYFIYDVFDVNSFCSIMKSTYTSLTNVQNYIKTFVVNSSYTSNYSKYTYKPCGLSMFCPVSGYSYQSSYTTSETNYTTWQTLVNKFGNWSSPTFR